MERNHKDGLMRFDSNGGGAVNYEPNGFAGPVSDTKYNEPLLALSGAASHYEQDKDYYTQPGDLYRLFPEEEKARTVSNITAAREGIPQEIRIRAIARFWQTDENCGRRLAEKQGVDPNRILQEVIRQQTE